MYVCKYVTISVIFLIHFFSKCCFYVKNRADLNLLNESVHLALFPLHLIIFNSDKFKVLCLFSALLDMESMNGLFFCLISH